LALWLCASALQFIGVSVDISMVGIVVDASSQTGIWLHYYRLACMAPIGAGWLLVLNSRKPAYYLLRLGLRTFGLVDLVKH
jgi:hypothetical protein